MVKKQTVELSILGESDTKPKIPRLALHLRKNERGGVDLLALDEYENLDWTILRITGRGTLVRHGCLANNIGLQIIKDGKILEEL